MKICNCGELEAKKGSSVSSSGKLERNCLLEHGEFTIARFEYWIMDLPLI